MNNHEKRYWKNLVCICWLFVILPVGAGILLHQTDNFFGVAHLPISKDKNLNTTEYMQNKYQLELQNMCSDRSDNFALCEFYYLSRLIGNAGLTQNMFEGLQDLCSSQVCFKRLNFLQSLVRGLLGVLYTFTDNVHNINTHGKILYWYFHWSIQLNMIVSTFKLCDLVK